MFTGIIQALGSIISVQQLFGDKRLTINTGQLSMNSVKMGDSIAVNGVCLTAIELGTDFFAADVSLETLTRTTLHDISVGKTVNLELALTPSTRMGGHIVSGHVDGIGQLVDRQTDARSVRFKVAAPHAITKYFAEKGSVAIDGISLTVNQVDGCVFDVNIVPHTMKETTLGLSNVGDTVNLEVDLLARYLERLMLGKEAWQAKDQITLDLLRNSGFIGEDHR